MLSHIKKWLSAQTQLEQPLVADTDELAYLVAALMYEAAQADGEVSADELSLITDTIAAQFELTDIELRILLERVEADAAERIELHGLLSKLREQADYEQRLGVLELVWMIVLADEVVDRMESQLMRRLAGLLFISDVDSGLAAQAAKKRISSTSGA